MLIQAAVKNNLMKHIALFVIILGCVLNSLAQPSSDGEVRMEFNKTNSSMRKSISLTEALSKMQTAGEGQVVQAKKRYTVSMLLPFNAMSTAERIDAFHHARETGAKTQLISEEAKTALDFYDGVLQALDEIKDSTVEIDLHVFDTWNNDSVTRELLKNKTVMYSNIIIGPATNASAKAVADFCKQRKIVNIQPFSPSKSLTTDNPYHIKIAPTIDAHIDNIVRSLADSFMRENIIIYCTSQESSLAAAKRLDSIIKNFDGSGKSRFTSTLFNYSNPVIKGEKKSLVDLLSNTKRNVVVVCVFDESNAQVVVKQLAGRKAGVVLYGMPTWLSSEILRLDYLNDLSARFTEQFVFDTTNERALNFYKSYIQTHTTPPGRYVWLGYDVTTWLLKSLAAGNDFPLNLSGTFFSGVGHKFQFRAVNTYTPESDKPKLQYYENTYLHLLRMENYVLKKEW